MMRFVILAILISLTIWSCGSRKVSRQKSLTQIASLQEKEEVNAIQVVALDKVIQRFSKQEVKFSANEISIAPDGGITIKEAVVERKSDDEVTEVDSSLNARVLSRVEENAAESILNAEKSKDVERKQFGWWILIPLGVVLVAGYCIRWIYKKFI